MALYNIFKEMNDGKYGDENINEDGLNIHIDGESDEILNSHITEDAYGHGGRSLLTK